MTYDKEIEEIWERSKSIPDAIIEVLGASIVHSKALGRIEGMLRTLNTYMMMKDPQGFREALDYIKTHDEEGVES